MFPIQPIKEHSLLSHFGKKFPFESLCRSCYKSTDNEIFNVSYYEKMEMWK